MELKKKVTIDATSYLEFSMRTTLYRNWITIFATSVFVFLFVSLYGGESPAFETYLKGVLYAIIYFGVVFGAFYLLNSTMTQRMYRKRNLGAVEMDVLIQDQGITQSYQDQNAVFEWNQFVRVIETKSTLLFYLNATQALIFPKRVCSDEELKQVKSLLQTKIPSKIKYRRG